MSIKKGEKYMADTEVIFKGLVIMKLRMPDGKLAPVRHYRCSIGRNKDTYGNGCYLSIRNIEDGSWNQLFDLRYNNEFSINGATDYIINWFFNNWSGENGSWRAVKVELKIEEWHRNTSRSMFDWMPTSIKTSRE